jgi:hypothetical protein
MAAMRQQDFVHTSARGLPAAPHLADCTLELEDGLVGGGPQVQEPVVEAQVLTHSGHHFTPLSSCLDLRLTAGRDGSVQGEGGPAMLSI